MRKVAAPLRAAFSLLLAAPDISRADGSRWHFGVGV